MAAARLMAVVVLPTPPFWLATVRMAVIECPARFYGRARASLGRWAANPPAWLSVPFRLPGPKPFGCQQSNRVRIATQAKNVQTINNKSAVGPLGTRKRLNPPPKKAQFEGSAQAQSGNLKGKGGTRRYDPQEFARSDRFCSAPKSWKMANAALA